MSDAAPPVELPVSRPSGATADAFRACFNEPLEAVLNLETWHQGIDLVRAFADVEQQIAAAVAAETEHQKRVRAFVVERLAQIEGCPPEAGHYRVPLEEVRDAQRGLLFNGRVEACDGTTQ